MLACQLVRGMAPASRKRVCSGPCLRLCDSPLSAKFSFFFFCLPPAMVAGLSVRSCCKPWQNLDRPPWCRAGSLQSTIPPQIQHGTERRTSSSWPAGKPQEAAKSWKLTGDLEHKQFNTDLCDCGACWVASSVLA